MGGSRKVLVVGAGGREHALAWKLASEGDVGEVVCVPGSDAIGTVARVRDGNLLDLPAMTEIARQEAPDLVVVGPEAPLAAGLADRLRRDGKAAVFGPGADGARIESSKAFAKKIMRAHQIPTAESRAFQDASQALAYARECRLPVVVKADGLASGKGVAVCKTREEAVEAVERTMVRKSFGEAGACAVLEEFLTGEELSAFAITDGSTIVPLASACDHKRLRDGDEGPNTGGMGAFCPAPRPERMEEVIARVFVPAVHAMRAEGIQYRGLLYAGLMWTAKGPRVLEFNCRFGDPETQPLLALMEGDLYPLLAGAGAGRIECEAPSWKPGASVCVVLASPGYPDAPCAGLAIEGLDERGGCPDAIVFHAGTRRVGSRRAGDRHAGEGWETAGGRVLGVTACGPTLDEARARAYRASERIRFDGVQFRRDIGAVSSGSAPSGSTFATRNA